MQSHCQHNHELLCGVLSTSWKNNSELEFFPTARFINALTTEVGQKKRKWARKRMEFPSLSQQNRDLKAPGLNWNKWVHYISFNLYLHVLHSEFKQPQSPKTPLLWEESEFKMTMDLWGFSPRKLTWILPFYLLKNYILVPVSICC